MYLLMEMHTFVPMKRLLHLITYVFVLLPAVAQTIVRDALDGLPVIQASVYDEHGKIIGVTDVDGRLPDVGDSRTIRLTHIAYHPLDVQLTQIGNELRMHPVTYIIKPVVVESKKDAYCLKLTCYYRQYMVNGKGTVDELPPVVSFVDGICNLYVFTDEYKTTHRVQLAKRQVISNDMESSTTDEELPGLSIHSLPERYREAVDKSPYTFKQDSTRHVINTTFSALYPDKSRPVRLNILGSNSKYQTVASPTMVKNLHQAVHQRGPYAKVSQGDLLAYSEVRQLKGIMKQRGREKYAMNLWLFDEYFPAEATFMNKQEYKAEQKTLKDSPQTLSLDDIDRYINEQQIPELSNDIQQKLEMTRQRQRETMTTSDGHHADSFSGVPQERIYLQTDKPYYAAGDTVWLRVHLLDAATNEPVSRSRFVYVELHDQQADTLMQRMMIRGDEDGVFANALLLPKEIKGGVYTLVAYTQWMRNFPVEQFCYQPLTIVGGQRARGHRIPTELMAQHDAKVSIRGNAATDRAPMTLDIDVYDKDGNPVPSFVLNEPRYGGCILVAGRNFGSGSSREHAAWAIAGYGFRVVISSFFADIHKNNELNNFVLPVVVSEPFLQELFDSIARDHATQVEVNLPQQTVTNLATGNSESFEINAYKKHCLMNGLDDIDFLVANQEKTEAWERQNKSDK